MKKVTLSLLLALVFGFTATATEPIDGETKKVNIETSKVTWKGYKFAGSHDGTIGIKDGSLIFDGEKLTGGELK